MSAMIENEAHQAQQNTDDNSRSNDQQTVQSFIQKFWPGGNRARPKSGRLCFPQMLNGICIIE